MSTKALPKNDLKHPDYWVGPKRFPKPKVQDHGLTMDERLAEANKVLRAIASHGRRFFWDRESDGYARFVMMHKQLWFQDCYARPPLGNRGAWHVFTKKNWNRLGWSEGGTMQTVVRLLANFIRGHDEPQEAYWAKKRGESTSTLLHPAYMAHAHWGYGPIARARLLRDLHGNKAFRPTAWNDPGLDPCAPFSLGLWAGPAGDEVPSQARFDEAGKLETCDQAYFLRLETRIAIGWTPLDETAKKVAFELGYAMQDGQLKPHGHRVDC